jgi:predicted transcriptional regulator
VVGTACPEHREPSDDSRLNYIPLRLQLAIMDLLSVFDVFGKNTDACIVLFSTFCAKKCEVFVAQKLKIISFLAENPPLRQYNTEPHVNEVFYRGVLSVTATP